MQKVNCQLPISEVSCQLSIMLFQHFVYIGAQVTRIIYIKKYSAVIL